MNIDFQRIWMLLDLIIKASQVGINETAHIVAAAKDEIKAIHTALGEERAAAKVSAPEPAPAHITPPIESIQRDAAGNVITDPAATLRR